MPRGLQSGRHWKSRNGKPLAHNGMNDRKLQWPNTPDTAAYTLGCMMALELVCHPRVLNICGALRSSLVKGKVHSRPHDAKGVVGPLLGAPVHAPLEGTRPSARCTPAAGERRPRTASAAHPRSWSAPTSIPWLGKHPLQPSSVSCLLQPPLLICFDRSCSNAQLSRNIAGMPPRNTTLPSAHHTTVHDSMLHLFSNTHNCNDRQSSLL